MPHYWLHCCTVGGAGQRSPPLVPPATRPPPGRSRLLCPVQPAPPKTPTALGWISLHCTSTPTQVYWHPCCRASCSQCSRRLYTTRGCSLDATFRSIAPTPLRRARLGPPIKPHANPHRRTRLVGPPKLPFSTCKRTAHISQCKYLTHDLFHLPPAYPPAHSRRECRPRDVRPAHGLCRRCHRL